MAVLVKDTFLMMAIVGVLCVGCERKPSDLKPTRILIDLPLEISSMLLNTPMQMSPDGTVVQGDRIFNPAVHPVSGTLVALRLYNIDIPLSTNEVKDGIITTADYGEIEMLLTGFRDGVPTIEFRALPEVVDKLRAAYQTPATNQEVGPKLVKLEFKFEFDTVQSVKYGANGQATGSKVNITALLCDGAAIELLGSCEAAPNAKIGTRLFGDLFIDDQGVGFLGTDAQRQAIARYVNEQKKKTP